MSNATSKFRFGKSKTLQRKLEEEETKQKNMISQNELEHKCKEAQFRVAKNTISDLRALQDKIDSIGQ